MKVLVFFLLIHLAAISLLNANANPYPFPIQNPYQASLLSAAASQLVPYEPSYVDYDQMFYPERSFVPFLKGRNLAKFRFYPQGRVKGKPLTFIMGGLGSTSSTGINLFYAKILHQMGHNVVSVSSPFFWRFSLGFLESAIPGYMPRDSMELYDYLKNVLKTLNLKTDDFSQINLTGYSLGAMESIYMADRDDAERYFNFKNVVAVNTPVNLFDSGAKLDDMYREWESKTELHKKYIHDKVFSIIYSLSSKDLDPNQLAKLFKNFPLSPSESKALAGENFRQSLAGIIFVAELVKKIGVINLYEYQKSPQPALSEAGNFTFARYFEEILRKTINPLEPEDQIYRSMGLQSKIDYLRRAKNLRMFHNADDIILKAGDIEFLQETLGDRLTVYPVGGHLGNIWFPPNIADFMSAFKK